MSQTFHRILRHAAMLGVSLAMSAGLVACGGGSGSSAPTLTALSVSPATQTIAPAGTVNLTVTGTYSNGSSQNVTSTATYASSSTAVATVSAAGVVTGVASGTSTITATLSGKSGTMTVTVAPTLTSIAVTPATATLAVGGTESLSVVGTYSDNSTQNLTAHSTYTSGTTSVATVSSAGVVTAVASGTATISVTATDPATGGTATGSASVTVGCCAGASAFELMSSDYAKYAVAPDANGAYLHSVQGGDVFSFAQGFGYSYDPPQSGITYLGYYLYQAQEGASVSPTDFFGLAFQAPANAAGVTQPINISQSTELLVSMGNTYAPAANGGHANVFTVEISNTNLSTVGTDVCDANVTLNSVGPGANTQNGLYEYEVPFTQFTCSSGTIAHLQSTGVSQAAVKVLAGVNSGIVASEFDIIAVRSIGFNVVGATPAATATSPYGLFASDFQVPASAPSNGSIGSSIQGGPFFQFYSSGYGFGCFDSNQLNATYADAFTLQVGAGANYNCGGPNSTTAYAPATDYAGLAFTAPAPKGTQVPMDISASGNMIIRMGNTYAPGAVGGFANVFTVSMNNAVGSAAPVDSCAVDVTLNSIGPGANTQNGMYDYVLPLTGFTCSSGSLAHLKTTGVTSVGVAIVGAKNPGVTASVNFDQIVVGSIGFQP